MLPKRRHRDIMRQHSQSCRIFANAIPHRSEISCNNEPELAFSADGSKFAIAMDPGVSVWDIRSKVPLQTFKETPLPQELALPDRLLQFSSGNLGKEILVFVEVRIMFTF